MLSGWPTIPAETQSTRLVLNCVLRRPEPDYVCSKRTGSGRAGRAQIRNDLRRTGRTLCSRAGAYPDHAELAYGHTVQGVRGVYDVWQDRDEKLRVLELLSAQIELIVNP